MYVINEEEDPEMACPMCRTLHHRLGRRNTLTALAAAPRAIRRALGRASRLRLTRRPGPDEWSAIQVLGHLLDAEVTLAFRIRKLAAEPGGAIVAWDQEKWTDGLRHHRADARTLLAAYTALRAANLEQVRRLSPAQRAAAGAPSRVRPHPRAADARALGRARPESPRPDPRDPARVTGPAPSLVELAVWALARVPSPCRRAPRRKC